MQQNNQMLHFPVGHIMDRVLSLFHIVVSDNTHIQAIDNGLKKGIKYVLNDAPVGQPASLTGENIIEINDNYCEFLYLICYAFLVINDCCLILTDNVEGETSISKEEAESYCREAGEMLSEALKMLLPNDNDKKYMAASRGKLFRFPNTSRPNKYTDFSDSMTIAGLTYILHHEFGHFIFEHDEDTPFNELDADKHAILHLKKWGEETKNENTIFAGTILALVSSAFINPTLTATSYPDIDDRIEYALQFADDSLKENPNSLLYRIIGFSANIWANHFNIEIPKITANESHKEYVCRIKSALINHKRKTKII